MHNTEEKVEPKLKIQIWEDDKFSADDFLGKMFVILTTDSFVLVKLIDFDHDHVR